jgi:hypothetical protein
MARICICADYANADENGTLQINGQAQIEGYGATVNWVAVVAWNATQAQVNSAVKAAGIAAAEAASGLTVGVADNKILIGTTVIEL